MNEELIEELAALEHEQWITWSKAVADEVGDERRERWEKYWVPYEQLSEDVKEHDRVWARKMILPVLSAIRDGLEIPGEVTRIDLWDSAEVAGLTIPTGGHTLIAFRKEKEVKPSE